MAYYKVTECPADGQRMLCLLEPLVEGRRVPKYNGVTIHRTDLYGEKNPWEIWEALGAPDDDISTQLYIFSHVKIDSDRHIIRSIGLGSWEPHCKDVTVEADDGIRRLLGVRKCFRFHNSGTPHDNAWILHEYGFINDYLLSPSEQARRSSVLCKLLKNHENPPPSSDKDSFSVLKEKMQEGQVGGDENIKLEETIIKLEETTIKLEETTIKVEEKTAGEAQVVGHESKRIWLKVTRDEDTDEVGGNIGINVETPINKGKGKPQQMVIGDKKIKVEEETIEDDHDESNRGASQRSNKGRGKGKGKGKRAR